MAKSFTKPQITSYFFFKNTIKSTGFYHTKISLTKNQDAGILFHPIGKISKKWRKTMSMTTCGTWNIRFLASEVANLGIAKATQLADWNPQSMVSAMAVTAAFASAEIGLTTLSALTFGMADAFLKAAAAYTVSKVTHRGETKKEVLDPAVKKMENVIRKAILIAGGVLMALGTALALNLCTSSYKVSTRATLSFCVIPAALLAFAPVKEVKGGINGCGR